MFLSPNPVAQNYKLQHLTLLIPVSIVGNATPASKVITFGELGGVCFLRTEGLTSVVDAMEATSTTNFATAVDATNATFGVFIQGLTNVGKIVKLLKVTVAEDGTSAAASIAVNKKGLSTSGVSSNNNVCFDVVATGLNLASETTSLLIQVDIMVER